MNNSKKKNNKSIKKKSKKPVKTSKKTNSQKVVKLNKNINSQNFINTKKIKRIFIVIIIILVTLITRIGYLQFAKGEYLRNIAHQQQSINQIISPKRGNIFDSTGKILATSAAVDTITINPSKIKSSNESENDDSYKEFVAHGLADIFEIDYNEVIEKVNSSSSVETIIKKVNQEKVDNLKNWMNENDIKTGINIDEDTKRYYPYNTVLAQVIGSCGNDNQGLSGIEYQWDSVLSGTSGKIVSSKSASQQEIPNTEEKYIPAENGSDITLTIDLNIQSIVEKYLKQAVEDNSCYQGGDCIAMNPKTGDILAMATYPNYDLNSPFTLNENISSTSPNLSVEEKNNLLYKSWSNKSVAELYEPGSVFKVITSSIALEETVTGTDIAGDFYCSGFEQFDDVDGKKIKINCWRHENPHGSQTLRNALENSCNPAFMQLGKRIGTSTLYKYFKAFGFFNGTNVDLPGEAKTLFTEESNVGPVERATMSFGQRFSITPLHMISAVSAIANDGVLMKPRIVKEITNTDTNAITKVDVSEIRNVISTNTANSVKSMMESVVNDGTGYRGSVAGYSVGGKTGTSEPIDGVNNSVYVASFVAISPVEDTQIVLLINLYDPHGKSHQGGTIAAPVVSQMLTEILPYLNVPSDTDNRANTEDFITVPDVRNKTITDAEKTLKNAGFTTNIVTNNDKNSTTVIDQVPKPGVSLSKNALVMLYDQSTRTSTTVPDLSGKSASQAKSILRDLNLNIDIEGSGTVVMQEPQKDSQVDEGSVVKVTLRAAAKDSQ